MQNATIMSFVLNLLLASLLLNPIVQAVRQVHVDTKKISEHGLSDPMPDVNVGPYLFVPAIY
jgi:hypothetical protein